MKNHSKGKGKAVVFLVIVVILVLMVAAIFIGKQVYIRVTGQKVVSIPTVNYESDATDGGGRSIKEVSNTVTQDEAINSLNELIKDNIDSYEIPLDRDKYTRYDGGVSYIDYDLSDYTLKDLGVTARLSDESIDYIESTTKIDNSELKVIVEFDSTAVDKVNETLQDSQSASLEQNEQGWFDVIDSVKGEKIDSNKLYTAVKEQLGLDVNNEMLFEDLVETSKGEGKYISIFLNDMLQDEDASLITSEQLNTRLENLEKIKVTYTNGYEIGLKDLTSYLGVDEGDQKVKFTAYITERSTDENDDQTAETTGENSGKSESGTEQTGKDNKETGETVGQNGETVGVQSGDSGTESQGIVLTEEQEKMLKELNKYIDKTIEVELASYDTVGNAREFKTSTGETVTVTGGTYGKIFSSDLETEYLIDLLTEEMEKAQSGEEYNPEFEERTPIYSRDLPEDIGSTYIEVSIQKQHVWVYTDGNLTMESDCVTGNLDGSHATPTGTYYISEIQNGRTLRPAGSTSGTWVNKWMRITNDGVGLHDAYWRSSFGGTIYKSNGSHGCINLPKTFAYNLFDIAYLNEPVIVY